MLMPLSVSLLWLHSCQNIKDATTQEFGMMMANLDCNAVRTKVGQIVNIGPCTMSNQTCISS